MTQSPSIGRIVHYVLTEEDAQKINKRRADAQRCMASHQRQASGEMIHVGNQAVAGLVYPMMIVNVWPNDGVNGQVFLDGNDILWVTTVYPNYKVDNIDGTWFWPPHVPAKPKEA